MAEPLLKNRYLWGRFRVWRNRKLGKFGRLRHRIFSRKGVFILSAFVLFILAVANLPWPAHLLFFFQHAGNVEIPFSASGRDPANNEAVVFGYGLIHLDSTGSISTEHPMIVSASMTLVPSVFVEAPNVSFIWIYFLSSFEYFKSSGQHLQINSSNDAFTQGYDELHRDSPQKNTFSGNSMIEYFQGGNFNFTIIFVDSSGFTITEVPVTNASLQIAGLDSTIAFNVDAILIVLELSVAGIILLEMGITQHDDTIRTIIANRMTMKKSPTYAGIWS